MLRKIATERPLTLKKVMPLAQKVTPPTAALRRAPAPMFTGTFVRGGYHELTSEQRHDSAASPPSAPAAARCEAPGSGHSNWWFLQSQSDVIGGTAGR